jgi:hypothetical protein
MNFASRKGAEAQRGVGWVERSETQHESPVGCVMP